LPDELTKARGHAGGLTKAHGQMLGELTKAHGHARLTKETKMEQMESINVLYI